jgi:hypothetical protein
MPETDGLAVAMAIQHYGQLPILLLTGYPKVPKELLEIVNGCVRKGQAAVCCWANLSDSVLGRQGLPDNRLAMRVPHLDADFVCCAFAVT